MDSEALALAIRSTGCRVAGPSRAGLTFVECPDDEAKIDLLDLKAWQDARYDQRVRALAVSIVRGLPDTSAATVARALHAAVRDNVRYLGEGIETIQDAMTTWETGVGDCDCTARLLLALARSLGMRARLEILRRPDGTPKHATVSLFDGRAYQWSECTIDADFGEHPIAALARIDGAPREDIGGDVGAVAANASTEAQARAAIVAQWPIVVPSVPMTAAALQAVQAIARHEGGALYGSGLSKRCPEVVHNWGATQLARSPTAAATSLAGPKTIQCPAGSGWCTDTSPNADGTSRFYQVCFLSFATDAQAVAFFLKTLLVQRPSVAAVIGSGNADAIAAAMYSTHYFQGFGKTDADRIASYAKPLAGNAATIAAALGEAIMVRRGATTIAGPVMAVAVSAASIALALWVSKKYGRREASAWRRKAA